MLEFLELEIERVKLYREMIPIHILFSSLALVIPLVLTSLIQGIGDYSSRDLWLYYITSALLSAYPSWTISDGLEEDFKSGKMAVLIRIPTHPLSFYIYDQLPEFLASTVLFSCLLVIFGGIKSLLALLFLPAVLLFDMAVAVFAGALSPKTGAAWGVRTALDTVFLQVLGGRWIPLDLLPFGEVLMLLPFRTLAYSASIAATGRFNPLDLAEAYVFSLLFFLLALKTLDKSIREMEAKGG